MSKAQGTLDQLGDRVGALMGSEHPIELRVWTDPTDTNGVTVAQARIGDEISTSAHRGGLPLRVLAEAAEMALHPDAPRVKRGPDVPMDLIREIRSMWEDIL